MKPKKKPAKKKSGSKAASVAGKYLEIDCHTLANEIYWIGKSSAKLRLKLARDIHVLAASVLSQREK